MARTDDTRSRLVSMAYRLLGTIWLGVWAAVLHGVHSPWRHLGGLVAERLRWLESFVLAAGVVAGFHLAAHLRETTAPETGRAYARAMRRLLYPVLASAALGMIGLMLLDRDDATGVVFTGLLAYWAGADGAMGFLPLLSGNPPTVGHPETEADGERSRLVGE